MEPMKQQDIYTIQGVDYLQMTIELLKACDLAGDIGSRKRRVGLKPNLVLDSPASKGATTHPELVDGVLTYLQEKGFENLVVLESSWIGASTKRALKVNGIGEVCRRHQVEFVDLQKDAAVPCQAAGMEISVCGEALKVDYLINMPVLKGHCQTALTCALKNMKGLIPAAEKRRFHTLGLHKPIAHLNTAVHQDFILVDNICGDLDFEEGGNPVEMNRILAFKDPVLCDSFAARTMGYEPEDIGYIPLANKLGVGSMDVEWAHVHQLRPQNQQLCEQKSQTKGSDRGGDSSRSPKGRVGQLSGYVHQDDACSACYGSLIYALDRLKEEGFLHGKKKESIAIGQGWKGKKGQIGVGSCTACFENSLKGCPPAAADMVSFLRERWE